MGDIVTDNNAADFLTKILCDQKKRRIIAEIHFDVYVDFYVFWGFVLLPFMKS